MLELLFFTGPDCSACRVVKPYVEKLKDERFTVRVIDISNDPHTAHTYGVRALPTLIVLDSFHRVLDTYVGTMSESQFINWLNKFLFFRIRGFDHG